MKRRNFREIKNPSVIRPFSIEGFRAKNGGRLDEQREELRHKMLLNLFVTLEESAQGMTLEDASRVVIDFAAGALHYLHENAGRVDLLNPMREADRLAQIIVAMKTKS